MQVWVSVKHHYGLEEAAAAVGVQHSNNNKPLHITLPNTTEMKTSEEEMVVPTYAP